MGKKKTREEFVNELKIKNPNVILIGDYAGSREKSTFRCLTHNIEWDAQSSSMLNGYGCKKCKVEKTTLTIDKAKKNLKHLFDIIDIDFSTFKNSNSSMKCTCKRCKNIWSMKYKSLLNNGTVCKNCKEIKQTYNQLDKKTINELLTNKGIILSGEYINSKTNTEFTCLLCGKTFMAKYDKIRYWHKAGCKFCKNKAPSNQNSDFIKKKIEKLNKLKSENVEIMSYDNSVNVINCKCLVCKEEYTTSYDSLVLSSMHRKCAIKISSKKQMATPKYIMERLALKGNDFDVDFTNYNTNKDLLKCVCNKCHNIYYKTSTSLLNGKGCMRCGIKNASKKKINNIEEYRCFIEELNLKMIGVYMGGSKKTTFECLNCGFQFDASPYYIKNNMIGCVNCNKNEKLKNSKDLFIQKLKDKNKSISIIGEYFGSDVRTSFYCSQCNNTFDATPHDLLRNANCKKCTDGSILEYKTRMFLCNNEIEYELHKRFNDLRGVNNGMLSYDFYIPSINTLIELQGKQHYEPVDMFGGKERFVIQIEHDKRKKDYALENGYRFIEISYFDVDNIESILLKEFKITKN